MTPLMLGFAPNSRTPVILPPGALLRHVVALGGTGSGKTTLCKAVIEEAVLCGIPAILIDTGGDLLSMDVMGDLAVLDAKGILPGMADEYLKRVEMKVWTPGSSIGIPVSMAPCLADTVGIEKYEDQIKAWGATGLSIASLCGVKDSDEIVAALSLVMEYADSYSLAIDSIDDFIKFLEDPPSILLREISQVLGDSSRLGLAKKLRAKLIGPSRLLFELGRPINVESLFGYEEGGAADRGKVRVSVIHLNTLTSQTEKEVFIGALANAVYAWMLQNPSPTPQGIFYLDECAPYLPPVRKPASKAGLDLLLRQGRKYGICMMLATQSPGDIDYNLLGQVGTWMLGRLSMDQQVDKVQPILRAMPGVNAAKVIGSLPAMPDGQFIMASPSNFTGPVVFDKRWLMTVHRTLDTDSIESIVSDDDRETFGG